MRDFPFEVATHEYMLLCTPGKRPNTVLCIEVQLFNVAINEYTEPLFYGRQWSYSEVDDALLALANYLVNDDDEPVGWIRATEEGRATRRASDEESSL